MEEGKNEYPWAKKVVELHAKVMAMTEEEIEIRYEVLDDIAGYRNYDLIETTEIGLLAERVNQLSW